MTDFDPLPEIRQRRAAISPTPWRRFYRGIVDKGDIVLVDDHEENLSNSDIEFIAHAPTDIDTLLAQVERLRGLLREIEFACSGWEGQRYCPACDSGDHQPDCKLAAELRST